MLSKIFITTVIIFISISGYSQKIEQQKKIDSINNLPYDKRIETSVFNLNQFLDNLNNSIKIDYKEGIADSNANLFLIYYYRGDYDISSEYFFKAIKLYKSLKLDGKAATLYGLYGYRLRKQDLKKSMYYMQKGIKMAEKSGARFELHGIYDNYGLVKEENKQYDSAKYFYNKALKMKMEDDDSVGIPYSLNKLATLYAILGDFSKSKSYLDDAYQRRLKLNDKVGIAENLSFYGSYYELLNEREKAIDYFQQALKASKEAGYTWLSLQIYQALAANFEGKKDYFSALNYFKNYNEYKDSIYNDETANRRSELEVKFETEEKEKQILVQRAQLAESKIAVERRNYMLIGLVLFCLFLGIIGYMVYRNQKIRNQQLVKENQLKDALIQIETQSRLQEERLRISRDLHDNIGSQLTFIISSLDNLKFQIKREKPELETRIDDINFFTRNTINELRDTIWAMNKENITLGELKLRIGNFVDHATKALPNINFTMENDEDLNDERVFSSFEGINLYRVIQEFVNNSIKHSQADLIKIKFEKEHSKTSISISDNGKGIDLENQSLGNGMYNMEKRIQDIGGEISMNSQPGIGTSLKIHI